MRIEPPFLFLLEKLAYIKIKNPAENYYLVPKPYPLQRFIYDYSDVLTVL